MEGDHQPYSPTIHKNSLFLFLLSEVLLIQILLNRQKIGRTRFRLFLRMVGEYGVIEN